MTDSAPQHDREAAPVAISESPIQPGRPGVLPTHPERFCLYRVREIADALFEGRQPVCMDCGQPSSPDWVRP